MNNAIIDAACISTQNECVKKKKILFFYFIKKSIMNFSESRQNRSRENREKSKKRFFSPHLVCVAPEVSVSVCVCVSDARLSPHQCKREKKCEPILECVSVTLLWSVCV